MSGRISEVTSTGASIRLPDWDRALDRVEAARPRRLRGRVTGLTGLVVRATLPGAWVGEVCLLHNPRSSTPTKAEVVGFDGHEALLMPLGDLSHIGMASEVEPTGEALTVKVGDALLGRILDGTGDLRDAAARGGLDLVDEVPVVAPPPDPLTRRRIQAPLATGVRAMDGLLTCGEGQRVGLFAAAGVGKSTFLGMLARNTEADVNVVALIGERGREVNDFLEESLGEEGLRRTVVVVATSDEPALVRLKAAHVATAIAGYFRDQGKRVMLLMDSVTRFARAQREVGLAAGEPPARAGFPPSVFSELPRLLERAGHGATGSITGFYTVLVEGDDMTEPVADEVRSILDGHVVLSRSLAARNHYPAIDVGQSVSRVMPQVTDERHRAAAGRARELLATYEENRDKIDCNLYQAGTDARIDAAIAHAPAIERFLRQDTHERVAFDDVITALGEV